MTIVDAIVRRPSRTTPKRNCRAIAHRALKTLCAGVLVSLVVAQTSGCALTPASKRSLADYTRAMDQVAQSADVFLTDFASGLKVQAEIHRTAGSAPAAAPEYPTVYDPPKDPSISASPAERAIASSRRALTVLRQYDAALVALAEGRSEQEVRDSVTSFGGALQTLASTIGSSIPGLSLAINAGSTIVEHAQDAANREELKQAVAEGRGSINDILAALELQTPAMYKVSVVATKQIQQEIMLDIARTAAALKILIARRGPPTDVAVASSMLTVQAELNEIGRRTQTSKVLPPTFAFGAGMPPYDAGSHAETQVFLQSVRVSGEKYGELIAKQNAYYRLMDKYVAALRETRRAFDLVYQSLNVPVDLREEIGRVFEIAVGLRDAVAAFRHPPVSTPQP